MKEVRRARLLRTDDDQRRDQTIGMGAIADPSNDTGGSVTQGDQSSASRR
jgi:hypothetical protein